VRYLSTEKVNTCQSKVIDLLKVREQTWRSGKNRSQSLCLCH